MNRNIKFEVNAINNLKVRTTYEYWNKIISFKHPSMEGKEAKVAEALESPDQIRISRKDEGVLPYYKKQEKNYICVVVKILNGFGFIITTYIT
jgi:hypothetical protein